MRRQTPAGRRARVERWIASLSPFFDVIATRVGSLKLGPPRIQGGPTFLDVDLPGDRFGKQRIRKSAIWWIAGRNVGFHVDFYEHGVQIEAWTGADRHVTAWISGKFSEATLGKDLDKVLLAAGLTDIAVTNDIRNSLFGMQNSSGDSALDKS